MEIEGGCYCGAVRYEGSGEPLFKGQCHCRECQYASGGGPNYVMALAGDAFRYMKGSPSAFTRSDLESPVTREFCGDCGTQLVSRAPAMPGAALIKVGTLDDPAAFEGPQVAIFTCDLQPFHQIPEGLPSFERTPG